MSDCRVGKGPKARQAVNHTFQSQLSREARETWNSLVSLGPFRSRDSGEARVSRVTLIGGWPRGTWEPRGAWTA